MRPHGVNEEPISYESRILRWARRRQEALITDARMIEIALEVGEDLPEAATAPHVTLAGDERRLRGIPVVGVHGGIGGAIAGTRPGARLA